MKRLATLAVIALVVAAGGATAAHSTAGHAKLRLLSVAPLKVKGTGFASGERVVVRLKSAATVTVTRRRITAGRAGAWVLGFPRLGADRCDVLIVSALGNRGSRAALKMPQPLCPPPLSSS